MSLSSLPIPQMSAGGRNEGGARVEDLTNGSYSDGEVRGHHNIVFTGPVAKHNNNKHKDDFTINVRKVL